MAVVLESEEVLLLCHASSMRFEIHTKQSIRPKAIFNVMTPFRMDAEASHLADVMEGKKSSRKRRRKNNKNNGKLKKSIQEDAHWALQCLAKLQKVAENKEFFDQKPNSEVVRANNVEVRGLVTSLSKFDIDLSAFLPRSGQNSDPNYCKLISLDSTSFFLPPMSHLYLDKIENRLPSLAEEGQTYNVVLLDPPWHNKHVRRERKKCYDSDSIRKGYSMQNDLDELFTSLKCINDLFDPKEAILLVWSIPNERIIEATEKWLKQFDFDCITQWIWQKVTKSGEPIVDEQKLEHKTSHEYLIIGFKGEDFQNLPRKLCLCSVPSAFHSHKPPLNHVLSKYVKQWEGKTCLEIFGRYLVPNWTTVGDQCLLFQNVNYYYHSEN